jgi:hypothetical protein
MTSFLPPLSTATAPHNEIICPELRILGAYLPRTQNFRGWPAQKIPAAEFIPPQKSPKNCRGEWSDFVRGNRAKPPPYFSYTFRPLLYPLPGSSDVQVCGHPTVMCREREGVDRDMAGKKRIVPSINTRLSQRPFSGRLKHCYRHRRSL